MNDNSYEINHIKNLKHSMNLIFQRLNIFNFQKYHTKNQEINLYNFLPFFFPTTKQLKKIR